MISLEISDSNLETGRLNGPKPGRAGRPAYSVHELNPYFIHDNIPYSFPHRKFYYIKNKTNAIMLYCVGVWSLLGTKYDLSHTHIGLL